MPKKKQEVATTPELIKHSINLVVGDASGDGHNIRETILVSSSLDKKRLEKAYEKGAKIACVDLQNDVCSEYEDSAITNDVCEKLKLVGIDVDHEEGDEVEIDADFFAELYMRIAKLGDPELEYDFPSVNIAEIDIGGYGLLGG